MRGERQKTKFPGWKQVWLWCVAVVTACVMIHDDVTGECVGGVQAREVS